MRSCRSSWAGRSRRPWPIIVWSWQTGHCLGRRSKGITPGSMLSFASGSAIKRITAGVKARRRPFPAKFRSAGRAFTLRKVSFERKKNTALRRRRPAQTQNWRAVECADSKDWPVKCDIKVKGQAARASSQKSSKRPFRRQQRKAAMALAPRTVQNIPERFRRDPITALQPASITPEPTKSPMARNLG